MGLQGIKNIIHQRYNSIPAIHQIPENLSKWWGYILVVPKRICCRRLWQWSNAFVLMHQRKPFLHRTSNLKKRICAQRQTERGGATTASQCARKKTTAQRATVSFFSSQPQAVSTINPNLQLPPMVVTTSFHQRKCSHNCTCQIDTQYTAHSIHQNELFFGENSKKRPVGVCVHRDVLALLGNAAIWFHYSPLHYPLHLSILLLAQHTLNLSL